MPSALPDLPWLRDRQGSPGLHRRYRRVLETASRRGEVTRLGPQHVKNGRIRIERTHGSKDVDIPMSAELQQACHAMPKAHLTYIVTVYGKPRSKYGLGNDFAKWATEAGLPTRCRLHGLQEGRHAPAR